jgi:ABC-type nickel/cobalt efflux system permease component RcnA
LAALELIATGESRLTRVHGLDDALAGIADGGLLLALLAIGLPLVLLDRDLPESVQRVAELTVGLVIVVLALRLLVRWRRGYLHAHPHDHADGVRHSHPHVHEHPRDEPHPRLHDHAHGDRGYAIARGPAARGVQRLVPVLATASLAFGAWYAAGAL